MYDKATHTHSADLEGYLRQLEPERAKIHLASHLIHRPHLQPDGSHRSIGDDIDALLEWSWDDLNRTHAEFHGTAVNEVKASSDQ